MPEEEGYIGVINLLRRAESMMDDGDAKVVVHQALLETLKLARQGVTNLEMGMELGRLLKEVEDEG